MNESILITTLAVNVATTMSIVVPVILKLRTHERRLVRLEGPGN